jgi:PAS domain S-box-containing protein
MANTIIKILAIDDNGDNLISINALIRETFTGVSVFTAIDGKTGIEIAAANDPDVILLDIVMPEMNGFEVCKILKSDERMKDIPVVFITAMKSDKENRIHALECGAEAFLYKPIDKTELTAQILAMTKIKAANRLRQTEKERLSQLVDEKTRELNFTHAATLNMLEDINSENEARKKSERALRDSEALFSSTFFSSPIPISITEFRTEKWIEVNEAFLNVTGYTREEIIGHTFRDLNLWKHYEDRENMIKILSKQGRLSNFEVEINKKNNESRIMLISVEKVLLQGKPFLLIMGNDITERKFAEEKYKTIVQTSPDGIFLINMRGIITEVSDIGLQLLGGKVKEDLVGRSFFRFIAPDNKNNVRDMIKLTLKEGITQNVGIRIKKSNNSYFAGETSTTLIRDKKGNPLSFMIVMRDISERIKTESKLIHADRMANLGEMAAGIAHEINQPLNIISLAMDNMLFESGKVEVLNKEFFKSKSEKIFDNITRIRNIIDHVRAFSRSDDGFVMMPFDINVSIENAIALISDQYKQFAIILELGLDRDIPNVQGNTFKFEQVILNLLSNARDAVLEKKSKVDQNYTMKVGVSSYNGDHQIIVEVKDNGVGISKNNINNVTLPFYTTKDTGKGTGLGLSISYQILKEMKASLEISSELNKETKIKIILDTNPLQPL